VNSRVGSFILWTAGLWALLFLPTRLLMGSQGVLDSLTALGLCFVPALLILTWAGRHKSDSPQTTVTVVFGGTALRMVFVLGGSLVLYSLVPIFQHVSFWAWVLAFYLYTLILEVLLLRDKQVDSALLNVETLSRRGQAG
jgi:Ca2+/Na+ antiporter